MADNKTLQSTAPATPAANVKLASREVTYSGDATTDLPAGAIVLVAGADDAKTVADLSGGAGAADAGTPRVIAATDSPDVTALQIMDDWDETDRAKVNVIVGQAGIAAGAGAVGATVPRVTLASDDPAVAALQVLDNIVAGSEAQVDVVGALPAGTNNIGDVDVASLPTGSVAAATNKTADYDTGAGTDTVSMLGLALPASGGAVAGGTATNPVRTDPTGTTTQPVSAASLPLPSGAATAAKQPALGTAGTPSTDVISVQGVASGTVLPISAASLPLPSGAATSALQGGGLPAALAAGGGLKVEGVAGGVAQPISAASLPLPTGAATAAEQATQTASLSVMDDWDNAASDGASVSGDVAHDAADAGEPVKIGAKAAANGANPTAVAAGDRTDCYADRHGRQWVKPSHPNLKSFVYLTTSAGTDDNVLPAIAAGTKYVITRLKITLSGAATVQPAVRLGFGTASVPALPASQADAADDILCYHPGMIPGTIFDALDGGGEHAGGDGAELRITNDVPTGGTLVVMGSYYTIES